MNRLKYRSALVLAVTLLAGTGLADDKATPEPQKFYRLDFVVKETDGTKVINSRAYSMQIATGHGANEIRAGSKVPFEVSTGSWQQLDVGTSIDCPNVKEEPSGDISLGLIAAVSSVFENASNPSHPIVRQNSWRSEVTLKPKRPTVVFSSDDVSSKHQMQLEVTATPIPPTQ